MFVRLLATFSFLLITCSSAWSDERIALNPYVGKYVGSDWEAPVTHNFSFEGNEIIGQIVYRWDNMNFYSNLSDLVLDGTTLTGVWSPNEGEIYKYEVQFSEDFQGLKGQYGDSEGQRAKFSGTIMSMSEIMLSGGDVCAKTNYYRCARVNRDQVRVLTQKEFFEIFDGRIFKSGAYVGGGVEFLIDKSDSTLNIIQEGQPPQKVEIAIQELSEVCFMGGGGCVDDSYVLLDYNKNPLGGILNDTFNIMYLSSTQGIGGAREGTFFDCGINNIDEGKLFTTRDCLLDFKFENFKVFANAQELSIHNNEFFYLYDNGQEYFEELASLSASSNIGDEQSTNDLKNVISAYEDYLTVSDYCGENKSTNHFQDLKESIGIVLDKLIEELDIPSSDIEATKDEAFNRAVSNLENNDEHQKMVIMIGALDESQSYKMCKDTVESMAPAYRMMAKQALKSKDKKNRDL